MALSDTVPQNTSTVPAILPDRATVVAGQTGKIQDDKDTRSWLRSAHAFLTSTKTAVDQVLVRVKADYTGQIRLSDYFDLTATHDSVAIQAAINDAINLKKKLILGPRPDGTLRMATGVTAQPVNTQSSIFLDIEFQKPVTYIGGSDTTVFKLIGVRDSKVVDGTIYLPGSGTVAGAVGWQVDTASASGTGGVNQSSATGIYFLGGGCYLGNGINNKGVLLGLVSGGGGDVSGIIFQNFNVNSAADNGQGQHLGAENCIAGQVAFDSRGRNTLNISVKNSTLAYLDKAFDNSGGGNGAWDFTNVVTSHCRLEYKIGNVQNYTWNWCRSEDSIQALHVTASNDSPSLQWNNCIWDNMVRNAQGQAFYFERPGIYQFNGGTMNNSYVLAADGTTYNGYDSRLFRLNNFSGDPAGTTAFRKGLFEVRGMKIQGKPAVPFFSVEGDTAAPRTRIYVRNVAALSSSNLIDGYYANRDTQ